MANDMDPNKNAHDFKMKDFAFLPSFSIDFVGHPASQETLDQIAADKEDLDIWDGPINKEP